MSQIKIYDQLYNACINLRGNLEPQRFRNYVLSLLFLKYVSIRHNGSNESWNITIPKGGSFDDIVSMKYRENIGEGINVVLRRFAESNNLNGIIDIADFNSAELDKDKESIDRISCLVEIFQNLEENIFNEQNHSEYSFLKLYDYLIHKFAYDSTINKEAFYTPNEISIIMARVIGVDSVKDFNKTLYDPACRSGSLLTCAADHAQCNLFIYGQEKNVFSACLARMRLFLHHKKNIEIACGKSALSSPQFKNSNHPNLIKTFDFVVTHLSFMDKSWISDIQVPDPYGRYSNDILKKFPEKKEATLWILHILNSLNPTGKAAVLLPSRVFFPKNINANTYKWIIKHGYIKGIINLPSNLLCETDSPSSILILDKRNASERKGIFIIDANRDFVSKNGKSYLRKRDIHKIISTFLTSDTSNPNYARFIANDELKMMTEYSIDTFYYYKDTAHKDLRDINALINGGIPKKEIAKMNPLWKACPALKNRLFQLIRKDYYCLSVQKEKICQIIATDTAFIKNFEKIEDAFNNWKTHTVPFLKELKNGVNAEELIESISRQLLISFAKVPILDEYDFYEELLEYWAQIMRNDVYYILNYENKKNTRYNKYGSVKNGYYDLFEHIKPLLTDYFYSDVSQVLKRLKKELKKVTDHIETFTKENKIDVNKSYYWDKKNNMLTNNFTNNAQKDHDNVKEISIIKTYRTLLNTEISYQRATNQTEASLNSLLKNKYQQMSKEEIIHFLIEKNGSLIFIKGLKTSIKQYPPIILYKLLTWQNTMNTL
ncbi:type I restriction enzyme M protein [Eubacterium maltosivorans]|uniref:class I SAM-dependent DNA methyltransferase n=1 Tax=Eubacterium maltosivorans TaxID=2041044 RepID=UPI00088349DB|nr:class I SAM-dependent DNA methyltransferase [Eubacterium maltosivorans]WPK81662.1 hypothetical protein EUMA32_31180 [Eubacterium maltosivorans]SDP79142.1 type I restriction enzyme M protein [Eubacterium maltosivorans]